MEKMILNIIGGAIIFLIGMLVGYHVGLRIMVRRTEDIINAITSDYEDLSNMIGGRPDGRT
jgi:uncharacterized protein YebE (UPF0316 family)